MIWNISSRVRKIKSARVFFSEVPLILFRQFNGTNIWYWAGGDLKLLVFLLLLWIMQSLQLLYEANVDQFGSNRLMKKLWNEAMKTRKSDSCKLSRHFSMEILLVPLDVDVEDPCVL